jgi:hypothetical protein
VPATVIAGVDVGAATEINPPVNETLVTVPVPAGKSAATNARNVGVAAIPDVGPENTVLAVCVLKEKDNAGVVVGVATEVVNKGLKLPALKLETVPVDKLEILPAVILKFTPARSMGIISADCAGLPLVNAEIFVFAIISP